MSSLLKDNVRERVDCRRGNLGSVILPTTDGMRDACGISYDRLHMKSS